MANCVGGTSPVCSSNGRCDITQYDTSLDAEVGGVSGGGASFQCNSLSGLNTGIGCLGEASEMCHLGPIQVIPEGPNYAIFLV